jgi:hypothetical protein
VIDHRTVARSAAAIAGLFMLTASLLSARLAHGGDAVDPTVARHFEYLNTNGNSNCSQAFLDAIASMPADARLQGSCCSPMQLDRYAKQLEGLKKYREVAEVPADPYDVEAGLAQKAMSHYGAVLSPAEQKAYDYAMAHSDEHGPCCCKCWRWRVYGGLAKLLIHEHGFSGAQITQTWNLSDGCGGDA